MDESMTPSSLDLLWPPVCNQCSRSAESSKMSNTEEKIAEKRTLPKTCYQQSSRIASQAALNHRFATQVQPEQMNATHQRQQMPVNDRQYMPNNSRGIAGPSDWFNDCSTEDAHHLEAPLPLQSVNNPSLYPLAHLPNQCKFLNRHLVWGAEAYGIYWVTVCEVRFLVLVSLFLRKIFAQKAQVTKHSIGFQQRWKYF